jgi:hypothetical protein
MLTCDQAPGDQFTLVAPSEQVMSMNGVPTPTKGRLEEMHDADAVLVCSGLYDFDQLQDESILARCGLNPKRQLIGAAGGGTLLLSRLGLLPTSDWLTPNATFRADQNIAVAHGHRSIHYVTTWMLVRLRGIQAARVPLAVVAPRNDANYATTVISQVLPPMQTISPARPTV